MSLYEIFRNKRRREREKRKANTTSPLVRWHVTRLSRTRTRAPMTGRHVFLLSPTSPLMFSSASPCGVRKKREGEPNGSFLRWTRMVASLRTCQAISLYSYTLWHYSLAKKKLIFTEIYRISRITRNLIDTNWYLLRFSKNNTMLPKLKYRPYFSIFSKILHRIAQHAILVPCLLQHKWVQSPSKKRWLWQSLRYIHFIQ